MPKNDDFPKHTYHRYRSYLLRLWQQQPDTLWRASLQDASTGERMAFLDLESLFVYLRQQAYLAKEADEVEPRSASDEPK